MGNLPVFINQKRNELAKNFNVNELSNNHLLPINKELEK